MPVAVSNLPAAWKLAEDGKLLTRPLEASEAAIENDTRVADGHYNIVQLTKFRSSGAIDKAAAEKAWLALRKANPEVALQFQGEPGSRFFAYPLVDDASAKEWSDATFTWAEGANADDLLRKQLNRTIPEPGRAVATLVPGASEHSLLINISHAVNDAQGTIALARTYISLLLGAIKPPSGNWGDELSRLPRGLAAALAQETGEFTPERLAEGQKLYEGQLGLLAKPAFSFPLRNDFTSLPNSTAYHYLGFNQAETAAVLRAAKSAGLTVTSAVNAAKLLAQQILFSSGSEQGSLICYTCNGRRWLASSLKDTPSAPSYASVINFVFVDGESSPAAASIPRVASHLQKTYGDILATPVSAWGFTGFLGAGYQAMRNAQDWDKPGPAFLSVSSIGRLDVPGLLLPTDGATPLDITDCHIAIRQCDFGPWSQVLTLGGQLRIAFQYNERYFNPAEMEKYLPKVKELLLQWAGAGSASA